MDASFVDGLALRLVSASSEVRKPLRGRRFVAEAPERTLAATGEVDERATAGQAFDTSITSAATEVGKCGTSDAHEFWKREP